MNILVTAVEVGSVRAILPVCLELIRGGDNLIIEKKGHFLIEPVEELALSLVDLPENDIDLKKFISDNKINIVLFSVNVHDSRPLQIARVADILNIKTIHILDYWNGYRARMELDGLNMFVPSAYLVPDNFALQKAIEEGIPSQIIKVAGQPALADVDVSYIEASKGIDPFLDRRKNKNVILFVLEPVANDQGSSYEENANYRGYTEKDVLILLIKALRISEEQFSVILVPHPRQNIDEIKDFWQASGGKPFGEVYTERKGQLLLPFVSGVIGMASTLLFEAWLVGKSVLSIQPGASNNPLEMLLNQDGFSLIDKHVNSEEIIVKWLSNYSDISEQKMNAEIETYNGSTQKIISVIKNLQ